MDHSRAFIKEQNSEASSLLCYHTLSVRKSYFYTFGGMRASTPRGTEVISGGHVHRSLPEEVVSANTLSRTFRQPLPFDTTILFYGEMVYLI